MDVPPADHADAQHARRTISTPQTASSHSPTPSFHTSQRRSMAGCEGMECKQDTDGTNRMSVGLGDGRAPFGGLTSLVAERHAGHSVR